MQDLPNMLEVWLRLCIAVNKPRKTSARRECAGLRLPLPLKPEILSHGANVVSRGLEVAVAIVLAELIKRCAIRKLGQELGYHVYKLTTTWELGGKIVPSPEKPSQFTRCTPEPSPRFSRTSVRFTAAASEVGAAVASCRRGARRARNSIFSKFV